MAKLNEHGTSGENGIEGNARVTRCAWVNPDKLHYVTYHDEEWGVAVHDDCKHFEMLILEGAQAGLNWETILKKREGYRRAFKAFDPVKVAQMTDAELEALREDVSIVRNRLKIYAARKNAIAFLQIQEDFGSFDAYVWELIGGRQIVNRWRSMAEVPAFTEQSDRLSKDLKKRGMSFVGSTIIYAYMQAAGLVNDHATDCWRYHDCIESP